MTKLYWRERDATDEPCAHRYSNNCTRPATHEKVYQYLDVPLFYRLGLSWLNAADAIPVCRPCMESDKDFKRRHGPANRVVFPGRGLHASLDGRLAK